MDRPFHWWSPNPLKDSLAKLLSSLLQRLFLGSLPRGYRGHQSLPCRIVLHNSVAKFRRIPESLIRNQNSRKIIIFFNLLCMFSIKTIIAKYPFFIIYFYIKSLSFISNTFHKLKMFRKIKKTAYMNLIRKILFFFFIYSYSFMRL